MTETEIAAMMARTAMSRIQALATGGYDVVIGTVKAPGTVRGGFYVALEHLELCEPEEFQGGNIETALAAAAGWAAERERVQPGPVG
jgi:hypothetical protein